MSDLTIFELNVRDCFECAPSLTVGNVPLTSDGDVDDADEAVVDADEGDGDDESGVGVPSLLGFLVLLAVVLLVAKRLTGDDLGDLDELDDLEG